VLRDLRSATDAESTALLNATGAPVGAPRNYVMTDIMKDPAADKQAPTLAGALSVDTLRRTRTALLAAIRDGAVYLLPLLDDVEDALIEAIAKRRREEATR
jgi:hypothetical protein